MNFFKNFLASVLGTLTAIGLFFTFILLLVSATASLIVSPSATQPVKSNSVLDLILDDFRRCSWLIPIMYNRIIH